MPPVPMSRRERDRLPGDDQAAVRCGIFRGAGGGAGPGIHRIPRYRRRRRPAGHRPTRQPRLPAGGGGDDLDAVPGDQPVPVPSAPGHHVPVAGHGDPRGDGHHRATSSATVAPTAPSSGEPLTDDRGHRGDRAGAAPPRRWASSGSTGTNRSGPNGANGASGREPAASAERTVAGVVEQDPDHLVGGERGQQDAVAVVAGGHDQPGDPVAPTMGALSGEPGRSPVVVSTSSYSSSEGTSRRASSSRSPTAPTWHGEVEPLLLDGGPDHHGAVVPGAPGSRSARGPGRARSVAGGGRRRAPGAGGSGP